MPIRYNKQVIQRAAKTVNKLPPQPTRPTSITCTDPRGNIFTVPVDDACYQSFEMYNLVPTIANWQSVIDCGYYARQYSYATSSTVAPYS